MRDSYQLGLEGILRELVEMADLVSESVRRSTAALLDADLGTAEQVIGRSPTAGAIKISIENRVFSVLALQTPVAGDLRSAVATLRTVSDLDRMAALAGHIAKVARMRYPSAAVPESLRPNFAHIDLIIERMLTTVNFALKDRNVDALQNLFDWDDEVDDLRQSQFRILLSGTWNCGIEPAVDVALLGRYYERIADHTASMGRHLIYAMTGDIPKAGPSLQQLERSHVPLPK